MQMLTDICSAGTEKKHVSSWDAFLSWKQSEQDAPHACFIQPKGEAKCNYKKLDIAVQLLLNQSWNAIYHQVGRHSIITETINRN